MTLPLFIGNEPRTSAGTLLVENKYTGKLVGTASKAVEKDIEEALQLGRAAEPSMAKLPSHTRQKILEHCATELTRRKEEFAETLCLEGGKPIRDARSEVDRAISTFKIGAEEAVRLTGEVMPLDTSVRTEKYRGMWKRVPVGLCSFITPFNFPLNLVAHKVSPAIAAGCPFLLKPASKTPLSALKLGEILSQTELPKGAFSILPSDRETSDLLITDERPRLLSFTGSAEVGWDLKKRAGKKKVVLELGGNAACIVEKDIDPEACLSRLIFGAFYTSGQSCISVQRIYIERSIYESMRDRLVAETAKLRAGDPLKEETFVGPLISETDAVRLESWIEDAKKKGARVLTGGQRQGAVLTPTLIENVPHTEEICREEAFGPVAILSPYDHFDEALRLVNQSRFGLQAGVFTKDIYKILSAWDTLEVGGVIINDVPSFRADAMPYGGVKDSGLGREGVRFAMEDMTEVRMLVIRSL